VEAFLLSGAKLLPALPNARGIPDLGAEMLPALPNARFIRRMGAISRLLLPPIHFLPEKRYLAVD
jgi:hypothetical protein